VSPGDAFFSDRHFLVGWFMDVIIIIGWILAALLIGTLAMLIADGADKELDGEE
jgi:hypothetical protein